MRPVLPIHNMSDRHYDKPRLATVFFRRSPRLWDSVHDRYFLGIWRPHDVA